MNVEPVLSQSEFEELIQGLSLEEKTKARIAFRHQRAMERITGKAREWTAFIARIHAEEILGESIDVEGTPGATS